MELQLVSILYICVFAKVHVLYLQLIEEIDERLSEERIEQLLKVVASELPCFTECSETDSREH